MSAARQRRPELSQHFLRSRELARTLVDLMGIRPSDLVVEVGPGHGALTDYLARRASRLVAVELDADLAAKLCAAYGNIPAVEVVTGDFLKFPVPGGARVAGSLPYRITADAIRHVVRSGAADAHFVVQREAAKRFAGSPWGPETLPSLSLKPWWHIEVVRALRRTDFEPPPTVDSAMLWLARRRPSLLRPEQAQDYHQFLETAFGDARTLGRALARVFTRVQIDRLRRDLCLDLAAPPSAASFDRWLALFRAAKILAVNRR